MSNKSVSRHYGYYGGVTKQNHYVPPAVPAFIPQPPTVPFYADYRTLVTQILSSFNITHELFVEHLDRILYRIPLSSTESVDASGNPIPELDEDGDPIKRFYMTNQEDPNDIITYVSPLSGTVDLVTFDAGAAPEVNNSLDGGEF